MQKSRLAGFMIDYQTGDLDAAAAFWSRALGLKAESTAGDALYRTLGTAADPRAVGPVGSWHMMAAPSGERFCLVRAERGNFATEANTWND